MTIFLESDWKNNSVYRAMNPVSWSVSCLQIVAHTQPQYGPLFHMNDLWLLSYLCFSSPHFICLSLLGYISFHTLSSSSSSSPPPHPPVCLALIYCVENTGDTGRAVGSCELCVLWYMCVALSRPISQTVMDTHTHTQRGKGRHFIIFVSMWDRYTRHLPSPSLSLLLACSCFFFHHTPSSSSCLFSFFAIPFFSV